MRSHMSKVKGVPLTVIHVSLLSRPPIYYILVFISEKLLLHGPPMMADKTNFGLVLYDYANFLSV